MKTITEFSGFSLKDSLTLRGELLQKKRATLDGAPASSDDAPTETPGEIATEAAPSTPAEATQEAAKTPTPRPKKPKFRVELTIEELSAAIREKQPDLAEERLTWLARAVETVDSRREMDLKRVVVLELAEGERAPTHARTHGTHAFIAEYFPSLNPPQKKDRPRGARGKGKGKGGGRRDRNNKKQDQRRGPRSGRGGDSGGPRPAQT